MAQLLKNFDVELAKMRSLRKFDEGVYKNFINSSFNSGNMDINETQCKLGLYPFIAFPRIESYEVDMAIPLPQLNQAEFDDVIDHYDFRRPWLMEMTEQNGRGKLILHSGGVKHGLDFTEVTQLPNGRFAYSVLRLKDSVVKIATSQGNEEELLETFYWIAKLFHAKHMKDYLDVSGGKKKHKFSGKSQFGNVTIKISLSAKAKKYHYPHQLTQNPNYTNGKCEIEHQVPSHTRRIRCGKGRTQIKEVPVKSFKRTYWIVPRDKVTKIVA